MLGPFYKGPTAIFSEMGTMDFAYEVAGRYMSGMEAILPADSTMATDEN